MTLSKTILTTFILPLITMITFILLVQAEDYLNTIIYLLSSCIFLLLFSKASFKIEYTHIKTWNFKNIYFAFFSIYAVDRIINLIFTAQFYPSIPHVEQPINYINLLIVILAAPILEEFIFRHVLFKEVSRSLNHWKGAILSSSLWTFTHLGLSNSELIQIFLSGLILCHLSTKKGGLFLCIIVHILINALYYPY